MLLAQHPSTTIPSSPPPPDTPTLAPPAPRPPLTGYCGAVAVWVPQDELVFQAAPAHTLRANQHQGFPAEWGHAGHLLINEQLVAVKLWEQRDGWRYSPGCPVWVGRDSWNASRVIIKAVRETGRNWAGLGTRLAVSEAE